MVREGYYHAALERMQGHGGRQNDAQVRLLLGLARRKDLSLSSSVRAWLRAQLWRSGGARVVPIPRTTRRAYLESNVGACWLNLNEAEMGDLEVVFRLERVRKARCDRNLATCETDQNRKLAEEEREAIRLRYVEGSVR